MDCTAERISGKKDLINAASEMQMGSHVRIAALRSEIKNDLPWGSIFKKQP